MGQVVVELSGDEAKLFKSYQRLIEQSKKLDDSHRSIKRSSEDAGKAGDKSFGATAVGQLRNYAMGFAGVASAVGMVTTALKAAREEARQAMSNVDQMADTRRRLLQVAQGETPREQVADWQRQVTLASELAQQHNITRQQAENLLFAARSENFENDVEFIAEAAAVISPESAATVAGQVPGLFPKAEVTPRQALNATLLAAQKSRLDFEQIAEALPQAAEGAALAGTSPEETMGLLSVMAARFKSGETAADRIKAMGAFIGTQEELGGEGVLAGVDVLAGMPKAQREKLLGKNKEVRAAYQYITEMRPEIDQRIREIQDQMQRQDLIPSLVEASRDPSTEIGRLTAAREEMQRAMSTRQAAAESRLAEGGYAREAALERMQADQLERGVNPLTRWVSRRTAETAADLGLPPAAATTIGEAAEVSSALHWVATALQAAADKLSGAADDQAKAAEKLNHSSNSSRQRVGILAPAE